MSLLRSIDLFTFTYATTQGEQFENPRIRSRVYKETRLLALRAFHPTAEIQYDLQNGRPDNRIRVNKHEIEYATSYNALYPEIIKIRGKKINRANMEAIEAMKSKMKAIDTINNHLLSLKKSKSQGNTVPKSSPHDHEFKGIAKISKAMDGPELLVKLPTSSARIKTEMSVVTLEKQIRAGFIPTLDNYSFKATGISISSYALMLQRIVAVAIQSVACMAFKGVKRERDVLVPALQDYLQRVFPGCVVKSEQLSKHHKPMGILVDLQNHAPFAFGFVLDCQSCPSDSTDNLVEKESISVRRHRLLPFCAIVLYLDPASTRSPTIHDADWLKNFTFPKAVLLKPRRFASLSTDIYNNALLRLNLKQNIYPNAKNFETAIMDCLNLFASKADHYASLPLTDITLTLPGVDTHLLRLEELGLNLPESVKYLVQPNVVYPAWTRLAHNEDAYFVVAVPFVAAKPRFDTNTTRDLIPRLVIMRHVDEALESIKNTGLVLKVAYK